MTSNCGFSNGVMYARNVDFSGELNVEPTILEDGQLLIGSSVAPFIRPGHLTSLDSSVTITEGHGTIDLSVGEFGALTFDADSGSASPSSNIVNVLGSHGVNSIASGDTITYAINNAITLGDLVDITGSSALTLTTGDATILSGSINLPKFDGMSPTGAINHWFSDGAFYVASIYTDNSNWFCGFGTNSAGNCVAPTCLGNTTLGTNSLNTLGSVAPGSYNLSAGFQSLFSLNQANSNTALGARSLINLVNGAGNIAVGDNSGSELIGSESFNLYLDSIGTVGDNRTIRIGTNGTHERAFISGVADVAVANQVFVSMNPANEQLGNITLVSNDSSITIDASSVPGEVNLQLASSTFQLSFVLDSGTAISSAGSINFLANPTYAGSSVKFIQDGGSTVGLYLTDPATNNTFLGEATAPSASGSSSMNTCAGTLSGNAIVDATQNSMYGALSGLTCLGNGNSFFGYVAGSAVSTGNYSIGLGWGALSNNTLTGDKLIAIGYIAGSSYSSNETLNIAIGNVGVAGDMGVIRIGDDADQTQAFIAGVKSTSISNQKIVAVDSTTGQLGAANLISSDSSISIDVSTPGSIDITTAGGGGGFIPFTDESADFTAAVQNGYFLTAACIATLPASPTQGQQVIIVADTLDVITIQANTGQSIVIGNKFSGVAGAATNSTAGATLTLRYREANSTWIDTAVNGVWNLTT